MGVAATVGLTGCTKPEPITVERAMAICTERARDAVKPNVNVGVGVGIGKRVRTGVGIGIELSSDYLKGRDPEEVYEECVVAKSGEKPTQPLTL
ncbi:hypothetical protein F9L33_00290 [Amylibacter sp. SFDW26]|nr:hypothetical protein F9L33_00290 [Amylibacter sp. SFDW26]